MLKSTRGRHRWYQGLEVLEGVVLAFPRRGIIRRGHLAVDFRACCAALVVLDVLMCIEGRVYTPKALYRELSNQDISGCIAAAKECRKEDANESTVQALNT